jgi:hypothetical protein
MVPQAKNDVKQTLDAALQYAASNWRVLPPNKKTPHTTHGKDDATTNEKTI